MVYREIIGNNAVVCDWLTANTLFVCLFDIGIKALAKKILK
jgi:hypothetical protein